MFSESEKVTKRKIEYWIHTQSKGLFLSICVYVKYIPIIYIYI